MLRGLTDRPNVQSTLILSRRDGSIIKATGIHALVKPTTPGAGDGYRWSEAHDDKQNANNIDGPTSPTKTSNEVGHDQDNPTTVDVLASSIFQFVNNASALGVTLGSISPDRARAEGTSAGAIYGDTTTGGSHEANTEEDSDHKVGEDEVQLLRLRTKHQEIIIFPDPSYICCVVQRVGKAGNGPERR